MKFKINALLVALVFVLFAFSACNNSDSSKYGHFERVGDLNVGRAGHSATLLKDGRVLIAGGGTNVLEIYDPKTRKFSITGKLNEEHARREGTLLSDGRVVFIGEPGRHVEIYNPKNNQVTLAGKTVIPRGYHAIIALPDDTVLITGGDSPVKTNNPHFNPDLPNNSAEIFNPKTHQSRLINNLNVPRSGHQALLLSNGKIAIIGGDYPNKGYYTVEFYDPNTTLFVLSSKIRLHIRIGGIIQLLNNGKILIFEGTPPMGEPSIPSELIDPIQETVKLLPYHPSKGGGEQRQFPSYAFINSNKIFLFGGDMFSNDEAVYDIPSNTFVRLLGYRTEQFMASVTALKDGSVLIAGGKGNHQFYKNSELFVNSK